jgi:hypothetical protein
MDEDEYADYNALRTWSAARRRAYLAAFGKLCALNVRGEMSLEAIDKKPTPVVRLLAKLWSDRAAELVDAANRDAHGGVLRVCAEPLGVRHYRHASELLAPPTTTHTDASSAEPAAKRTKISVSELNAARAFEPRHRTEGCGGAAATSNGSASNGARSSEEEAARTLDVQAGGAPLHRQWVPTEPPPPQYVGASAVCSWMGLEDVDSSDDDSDKMDGTAEQPVEAGESSGGVTAEAEAVEADTDAGFFWSLAEDELLVELVVRAAGPHPHPHPHPHRHPLTVTLTLTLTPSARGPAACRGRGVVH